MLHTTHLSTILTNIAIGVLFIFTVKKQLDSLRIKEGETEIQQEIRIREMYNLRHIILNY